jgi:hypothetical protein
MMDASVRGFERGMSAEVWTSLETAGLFQRVVILKMSIPMVKRIVYNRLSVVAGVIPNTP